MSNDNSPLSDNQIRTSFDYDKFKRSDKNRPIDFKKASAFLDSWKTKPYLIELNPIKVNQNMEIIDGQHRYTACKMGGFPIYYLMSSSLQDEDMIVLNKNQNNWSIENYIDFHVKEGNQDFIRLRSFQKKSGLSTSLCFQFLGFNSKNTVNMIKTGNITFPVAKEKEILENVFLIKNFQENAFSWFIENKQKNWTSSFRFYQALTQCFFKYDIKYILDSLIGYLHEFCLFSSSGDFLRKFSIMGILKELPPAHESE